MSSDGDDFDVSTTNCDIVPTCINLLMTLDDMKRCVQECDLN